jgi:hypothetical protein
MKLKIIVHDAEEGGYWAEVPAIPGCASQGETMHELMVNLREATISTESKARSSVCRSRSTAISR